MPDRLLQYEPKRWRELTVDFNSNKQEASFVGSIHDWKKMLVSRRALHWLKVWMNKKMYLEKWKRNPGDPSQRENACSDFLPVQAQALRALTFAILRRIPKANAEFFVSPSTIVSSNQACMQLVQSAVSAVQRKPDYGVLHSYSCAVQLWLLWYAVRHYYRSKLNYTASGITPSGNFSPPPLKIWPFIPLNLTLVEFFSGITNSLWAISNPTSTMKSLVSDAF